jgi:hypothetical protein
MLSRHSLLPIALALIAILVMPHAAWAHNVSKRDASFVQSNHGVAIAPFMYLGAEHRNSRMVLAEQE